MKKLLWIILIMVTVRCSSKQEKNQTAIIFSNKDSENITNSDGLNLASLKLPEGFEIDVFARVNNARSMAMSDEGTLFVGNRKGDKVYALKDLDGDYKADERYILAEGLRMPNGVAFKDGDLFVAEVDKLWRFVDIETNLTAPVKELIYDDYPTDGHHGWKYIAFGPDDKLYVPVGAPCNICESKNEMYTSITRMNPDGSDREIFVTGVRNTVGFTWHPENKYLYFTDNGRDMMSNDTPPCEFNRATKKGQHFGYPYCHGGTISDPEYGYKKNCDEFVKPVQNLGPHVAPLGVKFCQSDSFPEEYRMLAFIAEHGSWNRDDKIGYRITSVSENDGVGESYEVFISGWLNEETQESWGRPVDILFLKDGSMLISDDQSGTIYRVTYKA
ncbi:MAG: glucose/arabinose dehydrogenase [Cyclobacteriaceae bacterium]|jgi:glucose/arabinose dehydrogenase